jgi:hypothetical protein
MQPNYTLPEPITTAFSDLPPENFAEDKADWQNEPLPEHTPITDKDWAKARAYRDSLDRESPADRATRYFARYPAYPPDRFHSTGAARKAAAAKALQPVGWATKLFQQLDHPNSPAYFYSLHMTHLKLSVDYADPRFMYYPLVVEEIKAAIAAHVPAPYYWKLEVGLEGAAHVHLIAGRPHQQLTHLVFDGSKVIQPVRPGTEAQLVAYLAKPTAPWTASNYGIYLEAVAAKQTSRLPNLSGQVGLTRQRKSQS